MRPNGSSLQSSLSRNLCPDLNAVPALDKVAESSVDHALLLEDRLALERRRGDVDGIHAPAAARDILDE